MVKDIHLMSLCSELKVRAFRNGVHRACFLAKATVYAFCHVDIISAKENKRDLELSMSLKTENEQMLLYVIEYK